jgi:RimJ/RimL family protein N-acetyltransferase
LVPIIETERLRLRGIKAADFTEHVAMLADPEVMRHVGGKPLGREDAWRRLLVAPGLWSLLGFGYWAVERRSDGRYLGQAGFGDFKREIVPAIDGLPEAGWMFAAHAHGQGYATEAVAAAIAWGDRALPGRDFVAIIDPGNVASIRVARKSGFVHAETADYQGEAARGSTETRRRPGERRDPGTRAS